MNPSLKVQSSTEGIHGLLCWRRDRLMINPRQRSLQFWCQGLVMFRGLLNFTDHRHRESHEPVEYTVE